FGFAADGLLGGAATILYVGLSQGALQLFGGTIYPAPPDVLIAGKAASPGGPGQGSVLYGVPVPGSPTLAGVHVVSQVFALDPGAPELVSMTPPLRTTLQP